ncbi:MAG: hypothetical protein Q9164_001085 [Protoblastenia rupestris]
MASTRKRKRDAESQQVAEESSSDREEALETRAKKAKENTEKIIDSQPKPYKGKDPEPQFAVRAQSRGVYVLSYTAQAGPAGKSAEDGT